MKNKLIIGLAMLVFSGSLSAANQWYWGNLKSIESLGSDGSFLVYMENATIKQACSIDQIQFKVSDMGAERTKVALSMALTAFSSNKEWGVVIDLPSVESVCYASATTSTGAGIK